MGLYRLVNIPHKDSDVEIVPVVEGDNIYIVAARKGEQWRDGRAVSMASTQIGDHMMTMPDALRRMYAHDLASVIQMARDAGYGQAMADIRRLIGAKHDGY